MNLLDRLEALLATWRWWHVTGVAIATLPLLLRGARIVRWTWRAISWPVRTAWNFERESSRLERALRPSREEEKLAKRRAKEERALEKHRARARQQEGGTRRGGGQIVGHFDEDAKPADTIQVCMARIGSNDWCKKNAVIGSTPPRCKVHGAMRRAAATIAQATAGMVAARPTTKQTADAIKDADEARRKWAERSLRAAVIDRFGTDLGPYTFCGLGFGQQPVGLFNHPAFDISEPLSILEDDGALASAGLCSGDLPETEHPHAAADRAIRAGQLRFANHMVEETAAAIAVPTAQEAADEVRAGIGSAQPCTAKLRGNPGDPCLGHAIKGSTPPRCKHHGGSSPLAQSGIFARGGVVNDAIVPPPEARFGYLPKSGLFFHVSCPNQKENEVAPMIAQVALDGTSPHGAPLHNVFQCEGCGYKWSRKFIEKYTEVATPPSVGGVTQ